MQRVRCLNLRSYFGKIPLVSPGVFHRKRWGLDRSKDQTTRMGTWKFLLRSDLGDVSRFQRTEKHSHLAIHGLFLMVQFNFGGVDVEIAHNKDKLLHPAFSSKKLRIEVGELPHPCGSQEVDSTVFQRLLLMWTSGELDGLEAGASRASRLTGSSREVGNSCKSSQWRWPGEDKCHGWGWKIQKLNMRQELGMLEVWRGKHHFFLCRCLVQFVSGLCEEILSAL